MRHSVVLSIVLVLLIAVSGFAQTTEDQETEMVERYLDGATRAHTTKIGWVSANFTFNRINRANDYNRFTHYESNNIQGGSLEWLGDAGIFGVEFGTMFKNRFAWSLGGEYWLKLGQTLDGEYVYSPPLSTSSTLTDPSSEINVYGIHTGLSYYIMKPPDKVDHLTTLALKVNGTVGYYSATWDLWAQYENYNLTSSMPENQNISYKGSAPGLSIGLSAEYPIGLFGMVLGGDANYLYLNFSNMAWYNSQDQEVVVTYSGDADGRVDLQLSGVRAKVELKRFFSW